MTMAYYAGVNKVKVNLNVGAWKVLQGIMLSKNSQPQFNTSNIILLPKHEILGNNAHLSIYINQRLANFFYKVSNSK